MRFTSKFYALIAVTSIILLVVFYTNSNEPTKDYKAVGAKRYQSLNAQSIERLHDGSNPKRIKVKITKNILIDISSIIFIKLLFFAPTCGSKFYKSSTGGK